MAYLDHLTFQPRRANRAPEPDVLSWFECEGRLFEVLLGCGLASLRAESGQIYCLDRHTPGIDFSRLRPGLQVRCRIARGSNRVLSATATGLPPGAIEWMP